jgi:bacterioferritin
MANQPTTTRARRADSSDSPAVSREALIRLLNEDLAREYQVIIAYTVYSQVL